MAGVSTPYSFTLSTVFCISSSSTTRNGCPSNGWISESGIICTFSLASSALASSVEKISSKLFKLTFAPLFGNLIHLLCQVPVSLRDLPLRVA